MTREEFLSRLRLALQGNVGSDKVQENINFYQEYIIEEIRKGKSEEEVLQSLGDPALLAKTIITANDAGGQQQNTVYDSDEGEYDSRSENGSGFGYSNGRRMYVKKMDKWWHKLLIILTIVMAVLLVFAIVSGLIRIFAPIVVPIIIITIVIRAFGRRR